MSFLKLLFKMKHYGNDLLKLAVDDYGKDNFLRLRIAQSIPARILNRKRKHNFKKIVFSLAEKDQPYQKASFISQYQ